MLGLPTPRYAHLPLALNAASEKLSKQTLAAPLDAARPAANLLAALRFLGQTPPAALAGGDAGAIWDWVSGNWQLQSVPRANALAAGF